VTDKKPAHRTEDAEAPAGPTDTASTDGAASTTADVSTDSPAGTDGAPSGSPDDTTKSAFEAAIARKKAAGQARSAHLDGGAKVGGATASHKTSRTFRRKSG
jgi:hypothetical protein